MAMIRCPECAREVSDRAYACPACGYPIAAPPVAKGTLNADNVADIANTAGKVAGLWIGTSYIVWIARAVVGVALALVLIAMFAFGRQ